MIPEYVAHLRQAIGKDDLLWLAGVNAVVLNSDGQVLLQQNSDNHQWSVLSGILNPGESPSTGACREVWEETSVAITVDRLVSITVSPAITHANGDRAQYLEITFRCTAIDGVAQVNDDESDAVSWFAIDALPPMDAMAHKKIELATADRSEPWFDQSIWTPPTQVVVGGG